MTTRVSLDVLNDLRVASPCPMDWDRMVGDEKRRFCEHCGLHVHNTAAMTQQEVLALVAEAGRGGRVCARLYKRADGTLLTRDCPVGLSAARARLRRVCGRVAAGLALCLSGAWMFGRSGERDARLAGAEPFATLREWLSLGPPPRQTGVVTMTGVVCAPIAAPSTNGPGSTSRPNFLGEPRQERVDFARADGEGASAPLTVKEAQRRVAELERARLAGETAREE